MKTRSYAVARILAFIFSCIVAYALWTFLRPYFITPTTTELTQQTSPVALPSQEVETEEPVEQTTIDTTTDTADQLNTKPLASAPTPKESTQKTTSEKTPRPTKVSPTEKLTEPKQAPESLADNQLVTKKTVSKTASERIITVHNGIEKGMLGYKKFGTHYPTTFKISLQHKPLTSGASTKTSIKNNTLTVRYDFEFRNGYRNGAKEVTFTLKPTTDSVTLSYNWKGDHRLFAEENKIISITEQDVPYQP